MIVTKRFLKDKNLFLKLRYTFSWVKSYQKSYPLMDMLNTVNSAYATN
jgi:hypothetical protein